MEGTSEENEQRKESIEEQVALKVLQRTYSDLMNEYGRITERLSELSKVPMNNLYNPAVLHEVESMGHKKNFDELLEMTWIAQSTLGDLIAIQRTVCILKRAVKEAGVEEGQKEEREIDHGSLPYETNQ